MAKGDPCKVYPRKPCNWTRCNGDGCWREKAERALRDAIDGDKKAVKRLRECVDEIARTTIPPHRDEQA